MDFVFDQLFDGRQLQVLVIVDNHTLEILALETNQPIRRLDVVATLERITKQKLFESQNDNEILYSREVL